MRFTKLFPSVRLLFRRLNFGNVTRKCNSGCGGAEKKGAVICVYENNKQLELTPCAQEVDQKSGGKISQQLNTLASELKLGKSFAITEIMEYSAVAISCIGPRAASYDPLESLDEARENIRWGVGAGVKLLKERGCAAVEVDPCSAPDAAAEAAELAAWGFDVFKTEECRPPCRVCALAGAQGDAALWAEGAVRARAQNWARCLSDMPANKMTPVDLAQAALDALCHLGVTVAAHDREWIEAQRMRAFLAVARGSCDTPMFLECSYRGAAPHAPPVLLAAKGVTFDSGGLCLKECHSMSENRGSMAGAAVVLAALEIIARLKLPINVAGVIPICENMVSGQCMKVGDVVTALNGLSIQIENTDMEGRLMMADALVYGQSIYKPSLVIDVATFTHGVLMATGGGAFGCFSNSEEAWRAVQCAGAASGDRPWRFPLWQYFHKQITNDPSVDLRNKGSGHATPCLGAAFLKNFVCGDWVHMDITGVGKVAHSGAPPYLDTCRMTGRPTRTLAIMIQQIAIASCQSSSPSPPPCDEPCTPAPPHCNQPCTPSPPNMWPPCPPTSPPCEPQPPTSPPCVPCPPTSPPCKPQPPSSPPCVPCPPTSPPCKPQPPTSPPCGPQPPTFPSPGGPCAPPTPPCRPRPPISPPCVPQPSPSPPCVPQPPPSPPCEPRPPTFPSPGAPCPPTSIPCEPRPPTFPSPGGPCAPPSPPCRPRPPISPPCVPQPSPSPPCGPQPPRSPPCEPRPPTFPSPGGPCPPPSPPFEPRPPTFPSPGGPCPPPSPPCEPRPPTFPSPGGPCPPPSPPCEPRPPTFPSPGGPCPPTSPPCRPRPPTFPSPGGLCPPTSIPCEPRPPTFPSPGGPCPPTSIPCEPRPPTFPSPGGPCPPTSPPCRPRPPTFPSPGGPCPPPSIPCEPRPPTFPSPGSCPPTSPPTCTPPGPPPYETCPPSCLPGQPSQTCAPCPTYPNQTCAPNSLTSALTKHKCR